MDQDTYIQIFAGFKTNDIITAVMHLSWVFLAEAYCKVVF